MGIFIFASKLKKLHHTLFKIPHFMSSWSVSTLSFQECPSNVRSWLGEDVGNDVKPPLEEMYGLFAHFDPLTLSMYSSPWSLPSKDDTLRDFRFDPWIKGGPTLLRYTVISIFWNVQNAFEFWLNLVPLFQEGLDGA